MTKRCIKTNNNLLLGFSIPIIPMTRLVIKVCGSETRLLKINQGVGHTYKVISQSKSCLASLADRVTEVFTNTQSVKKSVESAGFTGVYEERTLAKNNHSTTPDLEEMILIMQIEANVTAKRRSRG